MNESSLRNLLRVMFGMLVGLSGCMCVFVNENMVFPPSSEDSSWQSIYHAKEIHVAISEIANLHRPNHLGQGP